MTNIPGVPDHAAEVAGELADRYVPPVRLTTATKAFVGGIVGSVTAAVTTGGGILVTALGDEVITGGEWVALIVGVISAAIGAGALTGGAVYGATNKPIN
jgi:hypothetical protein